MKVSIEWLNDHVPLDSSVRDVERALVDSGTEVNDVVYEAQGAVVARVRALHPIAESTRGMQAVDLDLGSKDVSLVSGAPNLVVGALVAYAPPGTRLPVADEPLQTRSMFHGKYESPGTICGPEELGIEGDNSGVLLLTVGTPGQPLHEVVALNAILDLEITTNRVDCHSQMGIAREVAAAMEKKLAEPEVRFPALDSSGRAASVDVAVNDPEGCPRFSVCVIDSVVPGASPPWMQRRLRAVGLRPINLVVDITNYVMYEYGQPLHAFDHDRFVVAGKASAAAVSVRRARKGEALACLDGSTRSLDGDLVVCSADTPVSIAGVMGGSSTAVHEGTTTVLLESANWNPVAIRTTSRRLGLRTDASNLFEKGLSDTLVPLALARATTLLVELGGGKLVTEPIDVRVEQPAASPPITVSLTLVNDMLGYVVDKAEAMGVLERIGCGVRVENDFFYVTPPEFRRDITEPVDIVEEVGRLLGYGRLPSTLPGRRQPVVALATPPPLDEQLREICMGAGYDEAITYSFTSEAVAARCRGVGGDRTPLHIANPLNDEWGVLRTSVLPGLVTAVAHNVNRGENPVSLFEIGAVYWEGERTVAPLGADDSDARLPQLPAEPLVIGCAMCVPEGDRDGATEALRHLQAVLSRIIADVHGGNMTVDPSTDPAFAPGRSGVFSVGGTAAGVMGELHPDSVAMFGVRGRIVVGEMRLDVVAPPVPRIPRFVEPPHFPAIVQDLSVVVNREQRAGLALEVIARSAGPLLESVELYDEYHNDKLGSDRKGWTFRLTYRAADRTLTTDEVQPVHAGIANALVTECGATVR